MLISSIKSSKTDKTMVLEVWKVGDKDQEGLGEISDVGHLFLDLSGGFTSVFALLESSHTFIVCALF